MPLATLEQVRKAREQLHAEGHVPTVPAVLNLLGKHYSAASVARCLAKLDNEDSKQCRPQVQAVQASIRLVKLVPHALQDDAKERLRQVELDLQALRTQLHSFESTVLAPFRQQLAEQAAELHDQAAHIHQLTQAVKQADIESALLRSELARAAHAEAQSWWLHQQLETLYRHRLTYSGNHARSYALIWPRIIPLWPSDYDEEAHLEHPAVTFALFLAHTRERELEQAYGHYKTEQPQLLAEIERLREALSAQRRAHRISQSQMAVAVLQCIGSSDTFDIQRFEELLPEFLHASNLDQD